MLEREKVCSSAAIATALAVSSGNQISPDGVGPSSLRLSNDRHACGRDGVYAVPRLDLHEIEWTEPDSVDAEVSRLVAGSSTTTTTTTRNNPRRCCRTSTSSGYSSHSPPLSAGSYSCYASALPGQGSLRVSSAPLTMRDQFGGLAVIHEGEAIPRPIWPSAFTGPREFCRGDDGSAVYDAERFRSSVYTCCNCGCAYSYSYCDWDYGQSQNASATEVLLELSRTLNSVIEGETSVSAEEILHNISLTVAQGMGLKKGGVYEHVSQSSSGLIGGKNLSSQFDGKSLSKRAEGNASLISATGNSHSKVNPVNSKVYSSPRYVYTHNSCWSIPRCSCNLVDKKFASSSEGKALTRTCDKLGKSESPCPVFHLTQGHRSAEKKKTTSSYSKVSARCNCKGVTGSSNQGSGRDLICASHRAADAKQGIIGVNESAKQVRNGLAPSEPDYAMLESSDGSSLSEGIITPPGKAGWDHRVGGFVGDLDFTLDVSRAERLGRAIAKAKRKRQWCRALTAFFGLVFFVLSVVIVSLSVTRGRKVFGSM